MQINKLVVIAAAIFGVCVLAAASPAQRVKPGPDYKITAIRIMPFNQISGQFEPEVTEADSPAFWNDISTSLFITVEVSGKPETFEEGRNVSITVTSNKRIIAKRIEDIGVLSESGKYYVPVMVYTSLCHPVTIKAHITGQKTLSPMGRTVQFGCGE